MKPLYEYYRVGMSSANQRKTVFKNQYESRRIVMRRRYILIFALLILAAPLLPLTNSNAQQEKVSEGQRLAMYSKPSVVRILDGYGGKVYSPRTQKVYNVLYLGSGSGAFIDPNGYISTNAHVVSTTKEGEDKAKEKLFIQFVQQIARDLGVNPQALTRNDLNTLYNESRMEVSQHYHHVITPDGSAFPFEIKSYGAPVGEGKDVAIIKIEIKNAPILKLGNSDKIQLQDHITVLGYPAAADTGLLNQKSFAEASITDGKVSARKNAQDGAPVLQISAPATHGNSGGPVLNDAGEVIGMLTFRGDTVGGQEVSGFTFVVPSSTMLEFIKQAGATNEESVADKRYREGLDLYWKAQYTAAIAKFEEVRRLFPQHSETERLIRDSQQSISEGKEASSFGGLSMVIIGGGLLVLLLGGGLVVVLMMRKKKPQPAMQGGYAQGASNQPSFPPQQQFNQSYPPQQPSHPAPQQHSFPQNPMQSAPPQQPMQKTAVISAPGLGGAVAAANAHGAIMWTTGPLAGQRFDIRPEGFYIGRDRSVAQIVVEDPRVSSRHVWVGLRNGRVVLVDSGSTNGTFLNTLGSGRVQEVGLNPGDTIIISEADVARFVYQR